MIRTLTIGDIHHRDCWKSIDFTLYDKVIFIGDYFDSFDIPHIEGLQNFYEIIELKKKYPDKIILLVGNHDIHYMYLDPNFRGSGFNPVMIQDIGYALHSNVEYLQIAFQIGKHLWTHAGVTNWFYEYVPKEYGNVSESLNNMLYKAGDRQWLFRMGIGRGGSGPSGVVWTGKKELINDPLIGFNQIVGHTAVPDIQRYDAMDRDIYHCWGDLYFTDCLAYKEKYLELVV